MAIIKMTSDSGDYQCVLDTEGMSVNISKNYTGIRFVSDDGEILTVCERDTGFEITYYKEQESQRLELKEGMIKCVPSSS